MKSKKLSKKYVKKTIIVEGLIILFLFLYTAVFWDQINIKKEFLQEIIITNKNEKLAKETEYQEEDKEEIDTENEELNVEIKSESVEVVKEIIQEPVLIVDSELSVSSVYSPKRILYVSKLGKDSNSGVKESPFLTINEAINNAQAGDEIRIGQGVYKETSDITGLKGTAELPIYIVGESSLIGSYPIIDGGDSLFSDNRDDPIFYLNDCAWISFERLKFIGGSESAFQIHDSSYISFRRNSFHINRYGVKLKDGSNHILIEFNEFYQSFGSRTWSDLKGTKWEGAGFVSYGGAGMNEIRYNYFHDLMNGVVLYTSSRVGNYYDANTWIHHNRFEDIVDDPFEPESYSFNNHFYNNTLINTHRMASFALDMDRNMLGPVYVDGNYQLMTKDPTGEADSDGRVNSALKLDLVDSHYTNGIYIFNNTVDILGNGTNTYGVDVLDNNINGATIINNIFRVNNDVYSSGNLNLSGSNLNYNFSKQPFNYDEPNGYAGLDPLLVNRNNEDGRLQSSSTARGKSVSISGLNGFTSSSVILGQTDLGAYIYGINSYRSFSSPKYIIPPGGEVFGFALNVPWVPDYLSGYAPKYMPNWMY